MSSKMSQSDGTIEQTPANAGGDYGISLPVSRTSTPQPRVKTESERQRAMADECFNLYANDGSDEETLIQGVPMDQMSTDDINFTATLNALESLFAMENINSDGQLDELSAAIPEEGEQAGVEEASVTDSTASLGGQEGPDANLNSVLGAITVALGTSRVGVDIGARVTHQAFDIATWTTSTIFNGIADIAEKSSVILTDQAEHMKRLSDEFSHSDSCQSSSQSHPEEYHHELDEMEGVEEDQHEPSELDTEQAMQIIERQQGPGPQVSPDTLNFFGGVLSTLSVAASAVSATMRTVNVATSGGLWMGQGITKVALKGTTMSMSFFEKALATYLENNASDLEWYGKEVVQTWCSLSKLRELIAPRLGLLDELQALRALTWLHLMAPPQIVTRPVDPEKFHLGEVRHFARFAMAAYGRVGPVYGVQSDNHPSANIGLSNEELICVYANISPDDLLHCHYKTSQYYPAHFVALDNVSESIVVGIRGTASAGDVLTDLVSTPVYFEGTDAANGNFYSGKVHDGMLRAAMVLHRELQPLIEELRAMYPSHPIVLCGHSLGAGVASLLALYWRCIESEVSFSADVRAMCFATPCTMDGRMGIEVEEFITSIIMDEDLVCRLSLGSVVDLRDSTYYLHTHGFVKEIANRWQMRSLQSATDEELQELQDWARSVLNSLDREVRHHEKLHPPGLVYWFTETHHANDGRSCVSVAQAHGPDFKDVVFAGGMISHHLPGKYINVLHRAILRPASVEVEE
eukprot:Clim_evm4s26 gene=Clim_evmTU4s26